MAAKKKSVKRQARKSKVGRVIRVGNNVLIRSVAYYLTGHIEAITKDGFVVLSTAAWVSDTGRFNIALKSGFENLDQVEIEPVKTKDGLAEISLGSVVDAFSWDHPLPTEVKG